MLEGDSSSKTFLGVRFFLCGFDPVQEQKVRRKLLDGGGVDVGHYSPNCTHVIVDKVVYDDPVCVAARNDAKTLVTGLWVDDSFDVGVPLDTSSIIYRPPKNLNGIPDAKSLIVCLTGYQRQDRDDIMTMVGLMGAQFSKPLVANKVTHLICYKFEGEKYELAKKIPKIKLVNHRWLEDCLRDWALLPEDNYNKSGYEMEMMEAEARDSEDEAENTFLKQSGVRSMYKSPQNIKSGLPVTSGLPKSEGDVPKVPINFENAMDNLSIPWNENKLEKASDLSNAYVSEELSCQDASENTSAKQSGVRSMYNSPHNIRTSSLAASGLPKSEREVPKAPMDFDNAMGNLSIPQSGNKLDQASGFSNAYVSKGLSFQDSCKFRDAIAGVPNDRHHRTLDPKVSDDETPNSRSPAHSAEKLSYSRQSPWKPTLSLYAGDKSNDGSLSCKVPKCKLNAGDDLASSTFKDLARDKIDSNSVEMPLKVTHLQKEEESSGILPQKRTMDLSYTSPKTQKMSHDANSGIMRSPSTDKSPKVKSASLVDGLCETTSDYIFGNGGRSLDKIANLDAAENSSPHVSPTKSSAFTQKALACEPPFSATVISGTGQDGNSNKANRLTTFQRLRKSSLSSKAGIAEKLTTAVSETVEMQNQRPAVEGLSPNSNNSNDPGSLNVCKEGNNLSAAKALRKKISKKTLGSRPKLTSANQKGPAHLDEDASLNDATVHSNAGNCDKSPGSLNFDMVSPGVNVKPLKEVEGIDVTMSGEVFENNIETMDDETEAPEEERELTKSIGVQSTSKCVTTEEKSEGVQHAVDRFDACFHGDAMASGEDFEGNDGERTVTDKIYVLAESTSKGDGIKGKKKKGKNRALGKAKLKPIPAVTDETRPKKVGCEEDARNENIGETKKEQKKGLSSLLGKSKSSSGSESKKEVSSKMKENRPIVSEDQTVRESKQKAGKPTVKSNVTPMKIDQTSVEISPNSTKPEGKIQSKAKNEPVWFILSGNRLQRKDFQQVIRRLKGRCCRVSHHWSYQATHFIAPDPIRRIEKFFAAAASGRWILKCDYLTACNQAGGFLAEEPYEWYKNGLSEDGAINLEAPRKWRLLRERTGHGAFFGLRIIIYGECTAPSLDTLKRVVNAGDGTILATSPPYTRFLNKGVDFAIVSPGIPHGDTWVQELLKHEIPCVVADYLVEYVCKPGYPLERHVLHKSHAWAEKSFRRLQSRAEEVVEGERFMNDENECGGGGSGSECSDKDIACVVCRSGERGEVMLICGNESGSAGCGVGTHIDCCDPPLQDIPEDDWFCPNCSRSQATFTSTTNTTTTTSSKKRKKGKSK